MNVSEATGHVRQALSGIYGVDEASAVAALLMEDITGLDRSGQLVHHSTLNESQLQELQIKLARLLQHEPIQYIMNKAWFYGMELYVDRSVLIPRPETEELVDWIIKDVKAAGIDVFFGNSMQADQTKALKIMDIGTGSGCIALALKKTMPLAEVWACDISDVALNVARRNGAALDIRVDFQGVDFLNTAAQKGLPTVDIIVSNPPYVLLSDKPTMSRNVTDFEPHNALFVPEDDPLIFYKALVEFGKQRLYPNGTVYMEIHESLGVQVTELLQQNGYADVQLRKDMQGKDRMVKAASPNPSGGGASPQHKGN